MHGTTEPHTPCLPSQCCALNLVMQQGCLYMGCQLSRRCQTCVHADDAISYASFMGPGIAPIIPAKSKETSAVQTTLLHSYLSFATQPWRLGHTSS